MCSEVAVCSSVQVCVGSVAIHMECLTCHSYWSCHLWEIYNLQLLLPDLSKNCCKWLNIATDKSLKLLSDLGGNSCFEKLPVKNIKQFNQRLHGWIVKIYFFVHYKHMAWICSHYRCWEKGKANIYITCMFYSKNTVQFVYTVPLLLFLWLAMKPL